MICARAACAVLLSFTSLIPENHGVCADTVSLYDIVSPVKISTIPPRPDDAISGSQFARLISGLSDSARQTAALAEIELGNIPDFMRILYPLPISVHDTNADVQGIIWVSPDYISIGSDSDFLRFPLALFPAAAIARLFGCVIPTPKIVDTVFKRAGVHLRPQPLPAGPKMRSCDYCLLHQRMVEEQLGGRPICGIIAGHKKDVVLTSRLWRKQGRIAIYGWHRDDGSPIQPLSTVHGERYADYSHGLRLVRDSVLIQGRMHSIYDVLENDSLAPLLSYEGVILRPAALMRPEHERSLLAMHAPDSFTTAEP